MKSGTEVELRRMPRRSAEGDEGVRGHVRHIAAERHDGGALPVDKLLQPTRGASRQIHGAPDARLEQRRRADRAFLGGEKIDQWRGIRFELDDADKDRA
jgi:hypothetical protein